MAKVKTIPLQGYYSLETLTSAANGFIQQQPYSSSMVEIKTRDGGDSIISSISGPKSPKKKSEEASFKHAMAERKRRKKINCHYDTLRKLFPHLTKRDKPTVLTETLRRVKELRKKVAEYMASQQHREGCRSDSNESCSCFIIPGEKDEVMVSAYNQEDEKMVKALICCEDRPGLNKDLSEVVRLVKGKVVKAEMATIGGRTKAEVVVKLCNGGGGGGEDIGLLKRGLKAVVENRAFGSHVLMGQRLPESTWAELDLEWPISKRARIGGDSLCDGL